VTATASATPTATPNCSPSRCTGRCSATSPSRPPLAGYQDRRDAALREVFDITCALAAYPPTTDFIELQKRLGRAIDTGAAQAAARPIPGDHEFARA
jgi:hypothetical protein